MVYQSAMDATLLAWFGAALLLGGEVLALAHYRNLPRALALSALAETGYVLLGLGIGGAAGDTGAIMHFGFQAVMRGLVVVAAWTLIRRSGATTLDGLAGCGTRFPLAALLFGFGLFSVMGLSPFKGSFSKFLVLYAAIEQGEWLLAAVGTLASVIAAAYYVLIIHGVCLTKPPVDMAPAADPEAERSTAWTVPVMAGLAALTVVMSLWPEPFLHLAERLAGAGGDAIPEFEGPWSALVLLPYLGGFVLYGVGRFSARARDGLAVLLALATAVAAWNAADIDPLSRLFALLFAGIGLAVAVYSVAYMKRDGNSGRYWLLLFLMIGSLLGVATAQELGNFYVFWELMTWTSYLLVIHEQTGKALRAGFIYFLICASGAYVMHFGILLLHAELGTFAMAEIAARIGELPPTVGALAAFAFLTAFVAKAGLVPLHSWLPEAHPVAPSSISAPMSGILTKAGLFGIAKILLLVFGAGALERFGAASLDIGVVISLLGCLTLIYGEAMAVRERTVKRMLAYSTLAQVGEIAAILGLVTHLALTGALMHIANHAVMKSLLFLAAGALLMRGHGKTLDDLRGLGRAMPVTAGCLAIGVLAIMGLPPFSGFVSKFLMIYAAVAAGHTAVAALILLGSVVGAFYYLRLIRILFFEPYDGPALAEAPLPMLAAIVALAALVVQGGLFPEGVLALVRPAADLLAARGGIALAAIPNLTMHWPLGSAVAALGALAVFAAGLRSARLSGMLAVAVMLATLGAVWLEADRFDALSFWFAALTAGVAALNLVYAIGYMAHGHAQGRFYAAFTLMIAGLIGLAGNDTGFGFFAFWELMSSWTLYAVIAHEETQDALKEGFKYFIFNFVGASLMFLGIVVLAVASGSFAFADLAKAAADAAAGHGAAGPLAFGLVLVLAGLLMKAAMLPLRIDYQMHPATAPTPVSGYISAVLLKSGPYGVLKLVAALGGAAAVGRLGAAAGLPFLLDILASIAAVTILYAGAMAMIQTGIKRLLIYSTVSQLGYILLGLSLGTSLGVAGGLMHLVNHMLLKDILFLAAGCILAQSHVHSLDELGGLGRRMPVTFGLFLFAGLSLSGIPPLNGFASKWLVYQAAFAAGHPLFGLAALMSSLFTLAAVLKFAHAAFMGAESPKAAKFHEAPAVMLVPMGLLAGASVLAGLFPGLLLVPIAAVQTGLGLEPVVASWSGGLPGGWHPGVIALLALPLALLSWWYGRPGRHAAVRTHVHACGVSDIAPSRSHVTASNLYETPERLIRRVLHAKPQA
ncbi:formate hydrogenlyase subunit 3/multisubunit Na+/H+ antiporter MnhD subunit [Azospirillum brasilense]|uniref:Formate hydrogenlyase subunit 3/multisubunit Na+/H+ antiporter MnhD subunit n=1 Tax=Azospirillum brasilense TaxID=192 RepID=A0A560BBL9_AZOBR|nr:proton-conducting transporter membrane subunit [Azospirillum brasilense]TWA70048.1 formate hydrogenlyase subunit 3/multisubunit Na+/H+ antiporter MnhD subunit [Azospirillum brasilense]